MVDSDERNDTTDNNNNGEDKDLRASVESKVGEDGGPLSVEDLEDAASDKDHEVGASDEDHEVDGIVEGLEDAAIDSDVEGGDGSCDVARAVLAVDPHQVEEGLLHREVAGVEELALLGLLDVLQGEGLEEPNL